MKFLIFAASHRIESLNLKLATVAANHVKSAGQDAIEVTYASLDMPIYNDEHCIAKGVHAFPNPFAEQIAHVDGIIVSAPEYNWSYPGSLKNIIDWTSRLEHNPLKGKTVLLLSATPGARGGITGLMHLKSPFEALHAVVYPRVFPLGNAAMLLKDGMLADVKLHRLLTGLIDDYISFTRKLSNA